MTDYAHPEVLVTTQWVAEFLNDESIRVLEVDHDPSSAYELGRFDADGVRLVDARSPAEFS